MTVKEIRDLLALLPDNLGVLIQLNYPPYVLEVDAVKRGFNDSNDNVVKIVASAP